MSFTQDMGVYAPEKKITVITSFSDHSNWDLENNAPIVSPARSTRLSRPRTNSIVQVVDENTTEEDVSISNQIALEIKNDIQYRTCGWKKTAALLFSEYIGIATMSFPWSYSVLGLVPALVLTFLVAAIVVYVSLVVCEFCLRHPEVKDCCDIALLVFGGKKWAWWLTAFLFVTENTFVQALHCLIGSQWLNVVTDHATCTVVFSFAIAVLGWICTLPRTFSGLSKLAGITFLCTLISVVLVIIFAGIQDRPVGSPSSGSRDILAFPLSGISFTTGVSATLNILYAFLTQMVVPSIMAEMKQPKDFPKALWVATVFQVVIFALCGSLVYVFVGGEYMTSPAFGSLDRIYEIISYSFMLPAILFLPVMHCTLSGKFIMFNLFSGTKHISSNTVKSWAIWASIIGTLWAFAFVIYEVVPFFNGMLSLIVALFEPYFSFFIWGAAYFRMRHKDFGPQFWRRSTRGFVGVAVNVILLLLGLFMQTAGTYVSIQSIVDQYKTSSVGIAFSCANTQVSHI